MAINKADFDRWLGEKIEFQKKIVGGAIASMFAIAVIAFLIEGGLLYFALSWGYGFNIAVTTIALVFAAQGIYVYRTAPRTLRDQNHETVIDKEDVPIRIAPTLSNAWTYAFGSLDTDQSMFEHLFGLMTIVPRMVWTARYLLQRVDDIRDVNVASCGKVLRLLVQRSERVEAAEIADKFPSIDITETLRQLSLIDGVVFLTKGPVGLSLATRFLEKLEEELFHNSSAA